MLDRRHRLKVSPAITPAGVRPRPTARRRRPPPSPRHPACLPPPLDRKGPARPDRPVEFAYRSLSPGGSGVVGSPWVISRPTSSTLPFAFWPLPSHSIFLSPLSLPPVSLISPSTLSRNSPMLHLRFSARYGACYKIL